MGYVFISYSTKNQLVADSMKQLLNQKGITSWMAPADIPAGSKYAQVINQAIKDCACVLLMLSEASQNSMWVAKEIERAVNYHKKIIPIQLEELVLNDEFEFYLSTDQIVSVQNFDEEEEEIQKLLNVICKYVKASSSMQNKVKKNVSENDLNVAKSDAEQKFKNLVNKLYDVLAEYRSAFQLSNNEDINKATMLLMKHVQQMYSLYERNLNKHQDIANKAFEIVEQYNVYVGKFNDFAKELNIGYGDKSNYLAQKAEYEFKMLIKIVLKYLA